MRVSLAGSLSHSHGHLGSASRGSSARRLFAVPVILVILGLTMGGCSQLFMSVNDQNPSKASIGLAPGQSVAVHSIHSNEVAESNGWNQANAKRMQDQIVDNLKAHGILATASDGEATPSLDVTVTRFDKGSAIGRIFFFWGYTYLDGQAILRTDAGKRDLEIKKTGQETGLLAAGDQTNDNINYFAAALATKVIR